MHKISSLFTACALACMASALPAVAAEEQALLVYTQDNASQAFVFSQLESVAFVADGSVVVNMQSGESVSFPADEFAGIRFGEEAEINSIDSDISKISFKDGTITSPFGEIAVYSVTGQFSAQGCDRLSLDGLPAGIYIVSTGGRTLKISVAK
ncbi:MAG: hypothetical protein HUK14_05865 [Muribaculaceae bacterium]|nr:hypothetical protein [Muribaculaceae bacterium]